VADEDLRRQANDLAEQYADQWAALVEAGLHPLEAGELVANDLFLPTAEEQELLVNDRGLGQVLEEERPVPELDEGPSSPEDEQEPSPAPSRPQSPPSP